MKKNIAFLMVCACLFFLCGCSTIGSMFEIVFSDKIYPFPNKEKSIESIELLYYLHGENSPPCGSGVNCEKYMQFELIRQLEEEEIPSFMEQLYALKTTRYVGDPPDNYGPYIAKVNYENGDTEYFGSRHFELVKEGAEPCAIGIYCFRGDVFEELFFEYAGDISHLKTGDGLREP